MPSLIGVSEFIDETREDYSSPLTSTFVSHMPQCRNTIASLEEVIHNLILILYTFFIGIKLHILSINYLTLILSVSCVKPFVFSFFYERRTFLFSAYLIIYCVNKMTNTQKGVNYKIVNMSNNL